jgi:beta-alanine--pyruvate transaminase
MPAMHETPRTASLDAFWMPFTANRRFKRNPNLFDAAKGMYYLRPDGTRVLDATAGLWCVNAGHCDDRITQAIATQAGTLDYTPAFQLGHSRAFDFAERLADLAPGDLNHVFFTNSGSESVDTALKMALAYHHARGDAGRVRLIGRERGYHGVNFGGVSVGGLGNQRKPFGNLLHAVDHLPHTYQHDQQAYTHGEPAWGGHLADELARIVALHDASTIAAVIVEPVAGSTGVLPPPVGYLKRLRELCDQHGILLIFDEVITGFGRLGSAFAATRFDVQPDIMTLAKGLTNGAVPMGAVIASDKVHDAMMQGGINGIEFPHGYTYSGHPLACAAGMAALDVYEDDGIFEHAAGIEAHWAARVHSLKGLPNVVDIRTIGMLAAVELQSRPGAPSMRAYDAHLKCLAKDVLVRGAGDAIVLSPPLIIDRAQIDMLVHTLAEVLPTID